MERLTKDIPQGNYETLMNYAYAKNENVHLIYAGGEKDVDLCEYTAKCCKEKNCAVDAEAIMESILMDCDCPIATMYWVAVQAAELRERLKEYEDTGLEPSEVAQLKVRLEKSVELPCKVGDAVYILTTDSDKGYEETKVKKFSIFKNKIEIVAKCINDDWGNAHWHRNINDFGKTVFLSREAAEAALKEGENEG